MIRARIKQRIMQKSCVNETEMDLSVRWNNRLALIGTKNDNAMGGTHGSEAQKDDYLGIRRSYEDNES